MKALALIGLAVVAAAAEGDVDVRVTLEPPEIPFHRTSRFTVAVEAPADAAIEMPDLEDHFGGVAVRSVESDIKALRGGRKRVSETYVLDPLLAGTYAIAPVEIVCGAAGDGQTRTIVPSPALRVRDLTDEERVEAERFAANEAPVSLPRPWWLGWPFWAAVGAGVVALGGAVWWVLRHRTRAERVVAPALPWEVAYGRLRELDQRRLPHAGQFEPYYVDLSSILRYYIEDRFLLHAPEQTTPEFLEAASQSGVLSTDQQQTIAAFLRHCDRVKFARYEPTLKEMEQGFEVVLRFVDETVPRDQEAREDAA